MKMITETTGLEDRQEWAEIAWIEWEWPDGGTFALDGEEAFLSLDEIKADICLREWADEYEAIKFYRLHEVVKEVNGGYSIIQ